MIKTQVQIPDELFDRAKKVAAAKEWSFAEIVRRGLEYMTRVNPPERQPAIEWRLPGPYRLGSFRAPEERWTELARED
jgi:hypothetical protein